MLLSVTAPRAPVAGFTPVLAPVAEAVESALHAPLEGCPPVVLVDRAYGRHTRQSSATAAFSPWMFATEPEAEPWWEIDLGEPMLVERVTLWLAPSAADARVEIVAHVIPTRTGQPAAASFRVGSLVGELPVATDGSAVLRIAADTVARFVRVELRGAGGAPMSLLVRGAEILSAPLFVESLLGSFARAFTLFADRPLFAARRVPGEGPFETTHRYREVWTAARRLSAALAERLESEPRGERVFLGLCTRNRPEWIIADLAGVMRGYVVVPLSPDDADERLAGILARCPLDAVLVEDEGAERFARLAARCPSLRLIIRCERGAATGEAELRAGGEAAEVAGFAALVKQGATTDAPPAAQREGGDLYTLGFTSGSTGVPKGAMRRYATFLSMVASYGVAQPAVHLSFQPLSHLSERMYMPAVILQGGLIGFSGGALHLLADLRALEPTALGSVPRLFEVVHAAHERALAAALAASPDLPPAQVEARVLAASRAAFGSRLQILSVGSAPSSPALFAFLERCFADLWVSDGYGSTEVGSITANGLVQGHVAVKLVPVAGVPEGAMERGEIWVRSPHVIDGYYGDPEASAAALDTEGFFRTGDLGERTAEGRVRVVGRVKNIVKLGQGEFVSVDRVEAELATCPVADQIFAHPDAASSALQAVVVPRAAELGRLLGVPDLPLRELAAHPEAVRVILRALADHGRRAGLASFELPRSLLVEPEPMSVASGLVTASGKLARQVAVAHYGPRLAALSAAAPAITAGTSIAARLAAVAGEVVGRAVDPDEPIHHGLGVDSLTVAELLRAAALELGREIPLALWFASRSLADLASRLDRGLLGERAPIVDPAIQDLELPLAFGAEGRAAARSPFEAVLLTGATGLLGVHLLEELVARSSAQIVCLVRAPSDEAAAARVEQTMARYGIPSPPRSRWSARAGDLAAPSLGLEAARWSALAEEIDLIVHAGAEVSWLDPYEALRVPNVLGTHALLRLAADLRTKPMHFVSTISAAPPDGDESSCLRLAEARASSGYGLSKWVAEQLVRRAATGGHPTAVYRPAMITGHSARGLGNPDDFVHRYLRACLSFGRYLDLETERLDMTPVDFVAGAIVALLANRPEGGATHHLTNLDRSLSYRALGVAMTSAAHPLAPASYARFRAEVVDAPGSPLRPLGAYFPEDGFGLRMGPWPCSATQARLAELQVVCPAVDARLLAVYLAELRRGER
jgi:fatty acid CoA ligase FadD9